MKFISNFKQGSNINKIVLWGLLLFFSFCIIYYFFMNVREGAKGLDNELSDEDKKKISELKDKIASAQSEIDKINKKISTEMKPSSNDTEPSPKDAEPSPNN